MNFMQMHEQPGKSSTYSYSRVETASPVETTLEESRVSTLGKNYVGWLEGVRAFCALYVVFHHIYIDTIPDYADYRYRGFGSLVFGQLAVVAFIVVSGYSLGLKPIKNKFRLDEGMLAFYRRRAWRILPPYWIALLFAIFYRIFSEGGLPSAHFYLRPLLVHAFLLQDILPSKSPNSAFWSIAIEAQIYILFPFVLIFCQRYRTTFVVIGLALLTITAHLLGETITSFSRINHLSPQLFVSFLLGFYAATFSATDVTARACSLLIIALLVPFIAVLTYFSIKEIVPFYFWLDIYFASLVAVLFIYISNNQGVCRRVCEFALFRQIGVFSFSLYLTHSLVLSAVYLSLEQVNSESLRLFLSFVIGVPLSLAFGILFFYVFERPFLKIRSWQGVSNLLYFSFFKER